MKYFPKTRLKIHCKFECLLKPKIPGTDMKFVVYGRPPMFFGRLPHRPVRHELQFA